MIGQVFGRWTVVANAEPVRVGRRGRKAQVLCMCQCGVERAVTVGNLKSGISQSCGCLKSEQTRQRSFLHGRDTRDKTYMSWSAMRARCNDPRHAKYPAYGERGIRYCERWNDFTAFLADMGERPPGTTLDRIDVSSMYEPGNCRWATVKEQSMNKRDAVWIEYQGRPMRIEDIAAAEGVSYTTAWRRYRSATA